MDFTAPDTATPFEPQDILSPEEIESAVVATDKQEEVVPRERVALPSRSALAQQAAAEEKEAVATAVTCPKCGAALISPQPVALTAEDKHNWLSHVLGEPRFRKTYQLYGGKVDVTFHTRTAKESDDVVKQVRLSGLVGDDARQLFYHLSAACSIEKVRRNDDVITFTYDSDGLNKCYPCQTLYASMVEKLGEGLLKQIEFTFGAFEAVVAELMTKADTPDFW